MHRLTTLLLAASMVVTGAVSSQAGQFDGWCIPGDGCMGDEMIKDDSFGTCEESCYLTNAVSVTDLNAVLYRLRCLGDGPVRPVERVMIIEFNQRDGERSAALIDSVSVTALTRCEPE